MKYLSTDLLQKGISWSDINYIPLIYSEQLLTNKASSNFLPVITAQKFLHTELKDNKPKL
jgi:hypothetical protein